MPDIRLFTDEQISNAVILGLRQRGVEVLSTPDAGRAGMADESHLVFARDNGYALPAQDRDFLTLAATVPDHLGIIHVHRSTSIGDTIRGVLLVTSVLTGDEMKGRLEYI